MRQADARLVFHHIPKTGGMAALEVLRHWFNLVRDYEDPTRRQPFLEKPVALEQLGPNDILCGHFCAPGSRLEERYPQLLRSGGARLFTILRDPLETMISLFHYERRVGFISPATSLGDYLSHQPDNLIASYFPCTERNYTEVLSRYEFIGLTERVQDSFDFLADMLGKPRVQVPRVNAHEGPTEPIASEVVQRFLERNALDYAVYYHALEHFPPATLPYQMTLDAMADAPRPARRALRHAARTRSNG